METMNLKKQDTNTTLPFCHWWFIQKLISNSEGIYTWIYQQVFADDLTHVLHSFCPSKINQFLAYWQFQRFYLTVILWFTLKNSVSEFMFSCFHLISFQQKICYPHYLIIGYGCPEHVQSDKPESVSDM